MPERQINKSSRREITKTAFCLPFKSTINQAIISTTPVLRAVPRLDSTPVIPTLAKIEVKLANTAESTA